MRQRELASYSSAPTHYQVPAAVAASSAPQPASTPAAAPQASTAEPVSAPTSSGGDSVEGGGGPARELPPALKARLQARGILRLAQVASESAVAAAAKQEAAAAGAAAGHFAAAAYAVPDPDAVASSGASTELPLPPGWFGSMDPTYHRVYYYNPSTGERSWERPLPGLPSGWAEAKDPASGVTYYYNAGTGGQALCRTLFFLCTRWPAFRVAPGMSPLSSSLSSIHHERDASSQVSASGSVRSGHPLRQPPLAPLSSFARQPLPEAVRSTYSS